MMCSTRFWGLPCAPSAGSPAAATPPSAAAPAAMNRLRPNPSRPHESSDIRRLTPPPLAFGAAQLLVHVDAPDVEQHQVHLLHVRRHVARHGEDVVGSPADQP